MNYQSHTNHSRFRTQIMWFVFLVGTVIVLGAVGAGFLQTSVGGSVGILDATGDYLYSVTANKQTLITENNKMARELEELQSRLLISSVQQETLTSMIRENFSKDVSITSALVLSRPPISPYDTYVLHIGTAQGVIDNQVVVSQGSYVIGDVVHVSEGIAQVELFSHPGRASVVSINGELYPAIGQGGGILSVQLPRSYEDTEYEIVTLPGITGYVLGSITQTQFDPQDSFVEGIIVMPVNIYNQEMVTISKQIWRNPSDLVETFYDTEEQSNVPDSTDSAQ